MTYLSERGLSEIRAELDYLLKIRRPRLARLLLCIPLIDEAVRCSIEGEQVMLEEEITELVAIIRRARIIRGVDIERSSNGTRSKTKTLADYQACL